MPREAPKSWPSEARKLYNPICSLGRGGFGAVWLATSSAGSPGSNETKAQEQDVIDISKPAVPDRKVKEAGAVSKNPKSVLSAGTKNYVAIKLVGHPSSYPKNEFTRMSESGYFRRECAVLSEISHPRIIKLIYVIEGTPNEKETSPESSPYCIVLEYCRGPTLEQMLKHGGAIGIYMAREITAQLVDTVSYLHGRGVLHRDIKPDNIIIAGENLEAMEACWSDVIEGDDAARKHAFNIKLIDFGFARPLHPEDIEKKQKFKFNTANNPEPSDGFFGGSTIDDAMNKHDIVKQDDPLSLSISISHFKLLDLSAVGHRHYAAPEMLKGMKDAEKKYVDFSESSEGDEEERKKQMHKQTLGDAVSDYGMSADAYSLGTTLRYMLTGVPPDVSINEFMANKNSAISIMMRGLKKTMGKNKSKRKKRYKYTSDLPREAAKVVLGLTHWNEVSRTTVRSARNYEWITSSYCMKDERGIHPASNEHHAKLDFLNCALERKV